MIFFNTSTIDLKRLIICNVRIVMFSITIPQHLFQEVNSNASVISCLKKNRVACFYFTFRWYLFHLFFVFFETFVRVRFESSSNQLRKKGTFCEQNSSLTATWFNSNPYLFSSKCHIKFWYNNKQVSCLYPASNMQADIHYLSFDFPLGWAGCCPKIKSPMRIIGLLQYLICVVS